MQLLAKMEMFSLGESKPKNGSPRHPWWAARNPWGCGFFDMQVPSLQSKMAGTFQDFGGWHPKWWVKKGEFPSKYKKLPPDVRDDPMRGPRRGNESSP